MRRPKFRAWDNQAGGWFKPVYRAFAGELSELLIAADGHVHLRGLEGLTHESVFPDRFVIEQWTGLRDKNGTDIYEGDVCRVDHQDSRYTVVDVPVQWVADEAAWSFGVGSSREVGWSHEVIGNVHENPDRARKDPS